MAGVCVDGRWSKSRPTPHSTVIQTLEHYRTVTASSVIAMCRDFWQLLRPVQHVDVPDGTRKLRASVPGGGSSFRRLKLPTTLSPLWRNLLYEQIWPRTGRLTSGMQQEELKGPKS